ncbi:MAG: aminotransferase class I/II-fold pyridoxal phosphate-dependent enzyme [Oscillospiraceae bacterium]
MHFGRRRRDLIPEPFYPNYNTFVRITGGSIRPISTSPEEGYRYADRARIEPLINEHTRAILMTNPGNPTGVVLSPEEVRLMAEIAREHDLFLIGDEVYREFVYGGEKLTTLLELEDMAEYVVVIDSVSKRFSACGARIGALISRNQELMANAMKICQGPAVCCNAGSGGCHGTLRCGFRVFRRCAGGVQKAQGHLYGGPLQNSRCDVRMS